MRGVGLYIEENLQEVIGRFHASIPRELGFTESALKLAAPILLQDIARSMRRDTPEPEPWRRAVVLVLSQPEGGVRGLLREFGLLRLALWETVASRGHAVPAEERRKVDRHLDEALALAAERWAGLVRVLPPSRARGASFLLDEGESAATPVRSAELAPRLTRGPRKMPTVSPPPLASRGAAAAAPASARTPPPLPPKARAAAATPPPLPASVLAPASAAASGAPKSAAEPATSAGPSGPQRSGTPVF